MQNERFSPLAGRDAIVHRLFHLRNRHYALFDFLVFALTPALALFLRTDALIHSASFGWPLFHYTVLALAIRMGTYHYFRMYQRYWRFVSIFDFAQLVMASSLALLITVSGMAALWSFWPVLYLPRSIPFIDAMLALLLAGGMRVLTRLAATSYSPQRPYLSIEPHEQQRTLIVGAGYTGAQLAREIRTNEQIHLKLVGFLDDDQLKQGIHLHNAPVLGTFANLPSIVQAQQIERVIIAMPSADGEAIRRVHTLCQKAKVTVQTMPGIHELLNGNVSISKLRNVQIEDLLRRAPIQTDIAAVRELLRGKRVLVTGAGGSIGSELCRQILHCDPAQLILVGHGENSIFEIHQELRNWLRQEQLGIENTTQLVPIIADLRFRERIFGIFAKHQPEVVFHAAAHKHVPLMETNPVEAITNNVLGTKHLLAASTEHGVDRFVMISTDKAVNPTNVMGASKRIAELLVLREAERSGRFYQVVRFGNVLGSRGSVIHTFKRQIGAGGPISVTHPDMVRYFMTIPEAVQLVLQAAVLGKGAGILMLDMGEPVKIAQLARDLIELSGLQVGRDIEIVYSGLRPGEKLFEEMFKPDEAHMRTTHEKIFIAPNASQIVPRHLDIEIEGLITSALQNDNRAVFRKLMNLLPEYHQWTASPPDTPKVREEHSPSMRHPVPSIEFTAVGDD